MVAFVRLFECDFDFLGDLDGPADRDGIRSVPDREQTDTEPRFIGLGQVGLLLQYNRSISEYNVGRS